MNARLYKNEYDPSFISYLKDKYTVESETEKVLELTGITEQDEEKFHQAMLKSYDDLRAIFPDEFTDFDEEVRKLQEHIHDLYYDDIIRKMLKIQSSPCWTNCHRQKMYRTYAAISSLFDTLVFLTEQK